MVNRDRRNESINGYVMKRVYINVAGPRKTKMYLAYARFIGLHHNQEA